MKYAHKDIDTEVIDNKLSLSKWDNEATFSIKHSGKVNHYPIRNPSPTNNLRWLNLGDIDPIEVPIEYELSHHKRHENITIVTYWSNKPALMYFGHVPASKYVGEVDIPEVRAVSRPANPYYMDEGLVMFDIHYNGHTENFAPHLEIAIKQVLKEEYDIDVYAKGQKLYYKDSDGNDIKISSPETIEGHTWTYLNIDCDYNTYLKYSTKEIPRDKYAYGLKRNYPNISKEVVPKIVERFAELLNFSVGKDNYTPEELKKIERLKLIHSDKKWIREGQRDDPAYHYFNDEGHEYEIILDKKPKSNIVSLEVETENLVYYYQPEEVGENEHRPVHVKGSFAVYHADETKHHNSEKYKAGKAFHLYRPWAVDQTGKKVWCSFDPNFNGTGDLEITIPQDFLDNAVYPVTIDPTFGYTTGGATVSNNSSSATWVALLNQTGFAGVLGSLWFYGDESNGANINFVLALYQNSNGARIDYTAQNNAANTSAGLTWNSYNMIVGATLSAIGYDIGLSCATGSGYSVVTWSYDTATNAGGTNTSIVYASPPPATEPVNTINNNKYSFFGSTNKAQALGRGFLNFM